MSIRTDNALRDLAALASIAPLDSASAGVRITLSATTAPTLASVNAILATGGASSASLQTLLAASFNGTIGAGIMSPPRQPEMVFSSHANWDATTATITGTDVNGATITDTFAIPDGGNATVLGTSGRYFATIVSIAIPAQSGASGTFTVGFTAKLPAGYYAVSLDKTAGTCWICWGDTAVLPSTGLAALSGTMPVRDGDVVLAPGGTKLSAILTGSGTGELAVTPVT